MTAPVILDSDITNAYGPVPPAINLDSYIAAAVTLVGNFPLPYDQTTINQIGIYVCCHLLSSNTPLTETYEGMKIVPAGFDRFLMGTIYGQHACMLDTQGYLVGWGKPKPRLFNLGGGGCWGGWGA